MAWVVEYTGKQEYEFGDLTAKFVRDITGKDDYEFGECARASRGTRTPSSEPRWCALIVTSRARSLTKSAVKAFTGKDEYEFGDVTKKIGQVLFGNKKPKTK